MAWQIALVLATAYSRKDLDTLVRQMPIWAVRTPERQAAALDMRKGAGELWSPEAALTLFVPASTTDKIRFAETCSAQSWSTILISPLLS